MYAFKKETLKVIHVRLTLSYKTSAGDINTLYNYCPLTKLREGNVFTCVCLSVHGGPHVTITYDALDLTLQPPPPDIRPWISL